MSGSRVKETSCRSRGRRYPLNTKRAMSPIETRIVRRWLTWLALCGMGLAPVAQPRAYGQTSMSWEQVKTKFESANPTLKADAINVEEMKAEEITAYLRPNPQYTLSSDGTQLAPHSGVWQPTKGTQLTNTFSYLHEREHKREL